MYSLNAAWKSSVLAREKRAVDRHYAAQFVGHRPDSSPQAVAELVHRRSRSPQGKIPRRVGELRTFCVGTYYEQESSGFLQALSALGPTTWFTNDLGGYGLRGSATGEPDAEVIAANGRCLIEQVQRMQSAGGVDVVIGTMIAQSISLEALRAVRSMGVPIVNIAMDDRLPEHWRARNGFRYGAIGLAAESDLVLHTTPEYVPRYLLEGCPAIFWPFGSDPDLFRPSPTKEFDVVFVGNNYGWRHRLIQDIERAGIRIAAFGSGFANGHIPASRVAEVFGKAKIILGYGYVSYSRRVTTLKLRDIDGPMAGGLYLTTQNPDLEALFEVGHEIDTYSTIRECVVKLHRYLGDDVLRARIAAAGRARAVRDHSWIGRLREAFITLGVLDASELPVVSTERRQDEV